MDTIIVIFTLAGWVALAFFVFCMERQHSRDDERRRS